MQIRQKGMYLSVKNLPKGLAACTDKQLTGDLHFLCLRHNIYIWDIFPSVKCLKLANRLKKYSMFKITISIFSLQTVN